MKCKHCESKITKNGCGVCKDNPFLCDNFVQMKQEPVSDREWWKHMIEWETSTQTYKEVIHNPHIENRIRLIIKRVAIGSLRQGEKNRDILYVELMEISQKCLKNRYLFYEDLEPALQKIKSIMEQHENIKT